MSALVLLLAFLGAAQGCSDRADPPAGVLPEPTAVGSRSSSASSATSEPTTTLSDEQQVEAAVRELIDAMDVAMRMGQVDRYEAITSEGCACRDFARNVKERFSEGSYEGAAAELVEVSSVYVAGDVATSDLAYRVPTYVAVEDDSRRRTVPGKERHVSVGLVQTPEGEWLVASVIMNEEVLL